MREGSIPHHLEDQIFTIDDIARLFAAAKDKLLKTAFIGAILVFLLLVLQEPKYLIEATFKEGIEKTSPEGSIKELLGGLSVGGTQPKTFAVMKSSQVLHPLARRFGLQAAVPRSGPISRFLRRIRHNLLAEREKPLPEVDWFSFENVHYDGEMDAIYRLCFSDRRHFQVFDASGRKKIAEAEVGVPVLFDKVSFTCQQIPSQLLFRKLYSLRLEPMDTVKRKLKKHLKIIGQKLNTSIYDLKLLWPDRYSGAQILNGLMEEYRAYLKRDYNQIATEQMANLEQRQTQVYDKLGRICDEYALCLSKAIEAKGFFSSKEELSGYLAPYESIRGKLIEIDVELARLERKNPSLFLSDKTPYASSISEIIAQKQDLQQQRDLIEISLRQAPIVQSMEKHVHTGELTELRRQREETEKLLETMQQTGQPVLPSSADRIDFSGYLENHLRLLSVRGKILQDRMSHPGGAQTELDGMDLMTARTLFTEYLSKLDLAETSMRHYAHLKEELNQNDFELGSLAAMLKDPVSQRLLERVNFISLQLKDEKHHSSKEGERWIEEIALHRKLLDEHLEQLWKVEELNAVLIRERMEALQGVSLDCINRQISVIDERLEETMADRQKTLREEKDLLMVKMGELRKLAAHVPDQWKQENMLRLKTTMGTKMVEIMTQVLESNTIGHQLHHVESKPLDFAIPPFLLQKSNLYLFSIAGGIGASLSLFVFLLLRAIFRGFPTFSAKLITLRYPFAGKISAFCDGPATEMLTGPDLETLRRLALFLDAPEKIVSLIGGKGPDYSYSLAQNLARMGRRAIVIRCDFKPKFQESDRPGLLQWLQNDSSEIPVRRGEGFDFILAGGFTPFSMETLQSGRFQTLLGHCKAVYDIVFIWLPSPLDLAETNALLSFSEKAIVTVSGEQTAQLTPFIDWAYDKNRLTFISFE